MKRFSQQQLIGIALLVFLLLFAVARPLLSNPANLVMYLVAIVVAITVHEFGHAWVADALGDHTARSQGRVSLNPVVHFDPVGALMILFTMIGGLGIGWGKPVPVNPRNLAGGRNGMAMVAVAGIIMNLLTAVALTIVLHLLASLGSSGGSSMELAFHLIATIIQVNVILAVFNFIVALPPLDGYNFLINVLPFQLAYKVRSLERFGPILLLLVVLGSQMGIFGVNLIGLLVGGPSNFILQGLSRVG